METRRPYLTYYAVAFLVLLAILGAVLPSGARSLVVQIMIFSIFAMGYDLCLGYTDQCSLGHSIFFGAGAYGAVLSILSWKLGVIPAIFMGTATGLVLGVLLGLICVRLSQAYFVIVTAIISAVFHLLAMDMTSLTGGDDGLTFSLKPLSLGFVELDLYNQYTGYYFILLFLAVSYLILHRIVNAPLGKIFLSIRENEKRALFLGYNVTRYKLIAFVLSGMFAALSGALYAITLRYTSADYFSFYWSILPIVWGLVGGLGTLAGSWTGVALMSLFQYYVSTWFTHYLLLFGILILIILRVSRKGFVGYIVSKLPAGK